jgi:hypothetical protein
LADKPFDPGAPPPIQKLSLGFLPMGCFRECEVHIVMDADRSDPRLLEYLSRIGMFSAYMQKPYGRAIVFTAGGNKAMIDPLGRGLLSYLANAGGTIHGSIKEERIIGYWLSAQSLKLPPVVNQIDWV